MSLRARVLAGITVVAVVLVTVLAVITVRTEANLIDQVDAQLAGAVGPVRGLSVDISRPESPGRGDSDRLSSLYVGVVDGGVIRTVVGPNLTGTGIPLPQMEAAEAVSGVRSNEAFTVESSDVGLRYRMRAYLDGRSDAVVVLGLPIDSVDNAVANLIVIEFLGALVILVALGAVAWWVVHLGVLPVKRMTTVASAIAGGDLSQRVPEADPNTEAGELGLALNQMLGRIETSFDERAQVEARLRRFVGDASHELRTPVATIRGYAELFRSGGLATDEALADAMQRTEQEALRMGSLVDDLLHLARLDQGRPLERQPVDLPTLLDDAAGDARAVDPTRVIETDVDDLLVVIGDEGRLRQVMANLVGNALVHTPAGSALRITARRVDDRAVIEVIDQGEGMAEEVVAHAFERFYRADPVRSRHQGGSGLGLAIVEATVRAHGGTTSLHSHPGAGTTVRVELPIEDQPEKSVAGR